MCFSPVERQVVPDRVLPALVRGAVVRVVLGYVAVYAGERQLLVRGRRNRLENMYTLI